MTYRVRRQAITGKLILQRFNTLDDRWVDAKLLFLAATLAEGNEFAIVPALEHESMTARIARYERRAAGQRASLARRKSQGATPEQMEPQQ